MSIAQSINNFTLPNDIDAIRPGFKLSWLKNTNNVDIFEFRNGNNIKQHIGDEADYLKLFMRLAEKLYLNKSESFGTYLLASNADGKRLYFKEFTEEEKAEVKYSYISLLKSSKELSNEDLEGGFSFYCEIVLEKANHETFEKRSAKVVRILKDDNRDAWLEIMKNKYDFLKVEMFVFLLQKLYSWGFQAIEPNGDLKPEQHYVRAIRPKPRGTELKRRS
ncbi:hypothetical protein KKA14_17100 [bacterium]|nr:hypothetical protein [bacterium]